MKENLKHFLWNRQSLNVAGGIFNPAEILEAVTLMELGERVPELLCLLERAVLVWGCKESEGEAYRMEADIRKLVDTLKPQVNYTPGQISDIASAAMLGSGLRHSAPALGVYTRKLPTHWASALVYDDTTGLDDDEEKIYRAWEADHTHLLCVGVDDQPEFSNWHDARPYGVLGCDTSIFSFHEVEA